MIPLIQKEVVERRKWMTDGDILDIIAIAESTPGPIAINAATFMGYKTAGFWGAVCCTTGVVLPSFLMIAAISLVLQAFERNGPGFWPSFAKLWCPCTGSVPGISSPIFWPGRPFWPRRCSG